MALGAIFLLGIVLFIALGVVFTVAFSKEIKSEFAKMNSAETSDYTADADGLKEVWSSDYKIPDDLGDDAVIPKAVRIPLTGMIDLADDGRGILRSESTTASTLRAIRRATEDPTVDAILLEVDSGGGGITASDILYHALVQFKESNSSRRIIVLMGDMAASGAYYASLPADRIIAHPTTVTGSIGVIMSSVSVYRLADKLGIADESITSGPNKAILNPMRELTEEQRALLQGTVDELYARFAGLVSLHRKIPMEKVKTIADGRIYTAKQALDLQLIDSIGYLDDARAAVYEALGNPANGVEFCSYEHKNSLRDIFTSPDFWGAAISRAIPAAEAAPAQRIQLR